jgi:transcription-repair coupling factor (superfamily II helicase)
MLAPEPALLVDYLPASAGLALVDPLLLEDRAGKLREEAEVLADTAWRTAASVGGAAAPRTHAGTPAAEGALPRVEGFAAPGELLARGPQRSWRLTPFGTAEGTRLDTAAWDSFRGDIVTLAERMRGLLSDG